MAWVAQRYLGARRIWRRRRQHLGSGDSEVGARSAQCSGAVWQRCRCGARCCPTDGLLHPPPSSPVSEARTPDPPVSCSSATRRVRRRGGRAPRPGDRPSRRGAPAGERRPPATSVPAGWQLVMRRRMATLCVTENSPEQTRYRDLGELTLLRVRSCSRRLHAGGQRARSSARQRGGKHERSGAERRAPPLGPPTSQ
jgi:hypothetical protein